MNQNDRVFCAVCVRHWYGQREPRCPVCNAALLGTTPRKEETPITNRGYIQSYRDMQGR